MHKCTPLPSVVLTVVFSFPPKAWLQHPQVRCTTKDAFSSTISKQERLGWKKLRTKGAWWRFSNFTQSLSSYSPSRSSPPPVCSLLSDSSVSCYRIEPATIAGVVVADVVLTLIIVAITYRFAGSRQKRIKTGVDWDLSSIGCNFISFSMILFFFFRLAADNIYMNTRAKSNINDKRLPKKQHAVEWGSQDVKRIQKESVFNGNYTILTNLGLFHDILSLCSRLPTALTIWIISLNKE